ncbi:hypothetical protein V5O48_016555 [Marasmius crinis-equi]|uniref:F-box domain-containing protein n=1 Tax=Marasmius crinis-equi TaxID=585013 RepID=A0ABR3ERD6_9AGAR
MDSPDHYPPLPTSSFTHVLNTNYTPNSQETKEIRAVLSEPEAELDKIHQEIKKLQSRGLELHKFTSKHRALLSPIRRIPHDILAEIFYHCLPNDRYFSVRSLYEAPLILTTICRTWREVALRTPRLWNLLHMQFPTLLAGKVDEPYRALVKRRIDGIKWWLSHAGSLALSISLYISLDIEDDDELSQEELEQATLKMQTFSEVLQVLLGYFPRWENVTFQVPAPLLRLFQNSDVLKNSSSTQLRVLSLSRTCLSRVDDRDSWTDTNAIPSFLNLPTLKRLSFHNERINLTELPERWSNLTHLAISARRYSISTKPLTALRVLSRCAHSLEYLMLDMLLERTGPMNLPIMPGVAIQIPPHVGGDGDGIEWPEEDRIHLPHLAFLTVRFEVEGRATAAQIHIGTARFFDALVAPSLKKLSVKIYNTFRGGPEGPVDIPFYRFLERSGCHGLHSLDLCLPTSDEEISKILREFGGSLVHLALTGDHYYRLRGGAGGFGGGGSFVGATDRGITGKLVGMMTPREGEGEGGEGEVLCPKLEYLVLMIVDDSIVPELLTFSQARSQLTDTATHTQLKYCQVNFRRALDDPLEISTKLKALRETGVRMRWRSVKGTGKIGGDHPAEGTTTISDELRDPYLWDVQFSVVY